MKNRFWRYVALINLVFLMVAMWVSKHYHSEAACFKELNKIYKETISIQSQRIEDQDKFLEEYKVLVLKMDSVIEHQKRIMKKYQPR